MISAASRYRELDLMSRTESATPHALVAILYAELQVALEVLARAIGSDHPRLSMVQHERATAILHALEAGLNPAAPGDFASGLARIYRQMRGRLTAARAGDLVALREVTEGVESLAEAWSAIAD